MFFFAGRGRHTMWTCDWSSDVCSSDLRFVDLGRTPKVYEAVADVDLTLPPRSRERRAGKGPRGRGRTPQGYEAGADVDLTLPPRLDASGGGKARVAAVSQRAAISKATT